MAKVKVETNFYSLSIYLDNCLHFKIKLKEVIAIQGWINREDKYIIEYSTAQTSIKCEYQHRAVWETILNQLQYIDFN